jgi:hypothetical protein
MTSIKALVAIALLPIALPALADNAIGDAAKIADKAKAEARADAKKPVATEKIAGQVQAPVVTRETASAKSTGAASVPAPYALENERWVPKPDRS